MGCDVFHSSLGRFYRQEDIYLSFTLHKCSDVVYVRDYDIEVCVYTSQLSTRLWVVDYSRGSGCFNMWHSLCWVVFRYCVCCSYG